MQKREISEGSWVRAEWREHVGTLSEGPKNKVRCNQQMPSRINHSTRPSWEEESEG